MISKILYDIKMVLTIKLAQEDEKKTKKKQMENKSKRMTCVVVVNGFQ